MIVICAQCQKQSAFKSCIYDQDAFGAVFTCPQCHFTNRVPFSAEGEAQPLLEPSSPGAPPKQHEETYRLNDDEVQRLKKEAEEIMADPDALEDVWGGFLSLLSKWEDQTAHTALLYAAKEADALAAMGACYRSFLKQHPGDSVAKKAQDELMVLAMAGLASGADAHQPQGIRVVHLVAFGLSFALIAYALFMIVQMI